MTYSTFPFFHQRFLDSEGNPLAGGSLTFYAAGSTALKDIYLDQSGTPAQNPMPLDSTGLPVNQYFGGSGEYDIIVKNSVGAIISKSLRINASGGGGGAIDSPSRGYFYYNGSSFEWRELSNVIVTWAIIDNVNPDILQSLLDGWDTATKEKIYNAHWGIASNENDDLSENTSNSKVIYFLEKDGDDEWVWIKTDLDIEYPIINFAEATLDYLHAHYDVNENEPSNYPSGIWTSRLFGGSYEWVPMNVREFPEPVFSIDGQLLRYRHSGSAGFYEWVSEDLVNTGKVKVDSEDPTSGYLENKVVSADNLVKIVKGAGSVGKKLSISIDVNALVAALNGRTDLTATPKGPAGGDLWGTYPDPIVRQLTGVGANLTVANDDGFIIDQGGRCIAAGKAFYGATKVERKCWSMITSKARVYRSFDYWKTYKVNMSLTSKPGILSNEGTQLLGFVYGIIPGTTRYNWMWIAGDCNYHWYASEHIPENYDNDGNSINWSDAQSFGTYTTYRTPCHVTEYKGVYFLNDSFDYNNYLLTTKDWKTFEAIKINNTDEEITVPGNDGYGNLKLIERDTGIVHKCTYNANNANWYKTWTVETAITLNDSATTVSHFPEPSTGDIWYSSIQSMYGTWVIAVAKDDSSNSSKPSYWYSEDGKNWYSVVESTFQHFWEANNDGTRWFASNFVTRGNPIVYQLLINQIPAHRQLVAEKGIIVDGDAFLTGLPSASALATDENGKIIAVAGSAGNFIRNQASDGTNDAPGNIFLSPAATINIRYEDTGTPANNVNWFSVSKDMLKLQGLDVNNPALIGYQAELTPSALALRGRPGTSYGIYNATVIINREAFNWVPNVNGAWYEFNYQDLGGGTAEAQGGYRFPRLRFRISSTDTVSAEMVHKIVDSNGAELSQVTNGTYGKALQIPTTIIAGTPNAQQLFDYSLSEGDPHTIAQDGSASGNCSGNRGFAFVAASSRTMTKGRMMITQPGGSWMRMGIYNSNGVLLAKSNRVAVASGMIWFPFTSPVTLVGGNVYYLAYWCDDTTGNLKFPCVAGRATYNFNPLPQLYDINNEMPNNLGTSGTATQYRPWALISE